MQYFLVGCYTHPSMGGRGKGIYTCGLEPSNGQLSLLDTLGLTNPAYLIFDKQRQDVFVVEESSKDLDPHVHSLKLNPDYGFKLLSQRPIPGEYACHLDVDREGKFLAVANYGTGNIVLYGLKDASITGQLDNVQHQGKGTNPDRQEGPHAHATVFSPDNKFLLVIDLGLDEVMTYKFSTGKLELFSTFKTKAGAGPRHLVFHPKGKHVFILNELDSTLTLTRYNDGVLSEVKTVDALPESYKGEKWAAAIHVSPNGKNIYTSNRIHDSISVFAFDDISESLELIQNVSSGGKIPRDFSLDPTGKFLITAHQNSDDLFSFFVDDAGRLEPTGYNLKLGSPICVKFL